ncbi:hypothetical protein C2U69_31055 [Cupriavidus pinatubonensis]|nr:hypothetical protein C2U69_31055 [Cupriavidus pinatubonensis]
MSHPFSGAEDYHDMILGAAPVDTLVVADHERARPLIVGNDHTFAEGCEIGLEFHGSVHKTHIGKQ